jgi:hypothetical protein
MSRIIDAFTQFFDDDGDPLIDGWLAFKKSGTNNTDKDTFADNNETIANANPVQLDGAGRCPNVFGTGTYRVISYTNDPVLDQPSVQIQQFDPVGEAAQDTGFPSWDSTSIYNIPDIVVGDDLNFYRSLTNSNENNDPTSDAVNWEQLEFQQVYNANKTYGLGDRVIDTDGISYTSLQAANTGNTPTSSPTWWGFVIGSPITTNGTEIQLGEPLNADGNIIKESFGASVASATNMTLGTDGNVFLITGTTEIETINPISNGTCVKLIHNGGHNLKSSNNLLLPNGGNDILCEIGDKSYWTQRTATKWECLFFQRASGKPLVSFYPETDSQSLVKAWVSCDSSGTILDSFNVTSVVRNSAGDYTISWDTNFANSNYAYAHGNTDPSHTLMSATSKANATMTVITQNTSLTKLDRAFSLIAIGDQ